MNSKAGGEILSYRNVAVGESSQHGTAGGNWEKVKEYWFWEPNGKRVWVENVCQALQKHQDSLFPNNKLEEYRKYMKDHTLICKFIGAWPIEKKFIK